MSLVANTLNITNGNSNGHLSNITIREIQQKDDINQICNLIKNCSRADFYRCCQNSVTSIRCQPLLILLSTWIGSYSYGKQSEDYWGVIVSIISYFTLCGLLELVFEMDHKTYLNSMAEDFKFDSRRYIQGDCYKMWLALSPCDSGNVIIKGCIAIKPLSQKTFAYITERKPYLQVLYLRTDKKYRGKGIATSLYKVVLKYIQNRSDIKTLVLNTAPLYVDRASWFYQRRGFEPKHYNTVYKGPHKLLNCDMFFHLSHKTSIELYN